MLMAKKYYDKYKSEPKKFVSKVGELDSDEAYKEASGASTYASQRMKKKIEVAEKIFKNA